MTAYTHYQHRLCYVCGKQIFVGISVDEYLVPPPPGKSVEQSYTKLITFEGVDMTEQHLCSEHSELVNLFIEELKNDPDPG